MFEKALATNADSLILDLEDSVTPENKEAARDHVCNWITETDFGIQECLVRINPQDTPWGEDDLRAVMEVLPDGLVLPKIATLQDVDAIASVVTEIEKNLETVPGAVSLLLIGTEVAEAVFNLPAMAKHDRVDAVTWGAEDLSGALGAKAKRDAQGNYLEVFSFVRSTCLLRRISPVLLYLTSQPQPLHDSSHQGTHLFDHALPNSHLGNQNKVCEQIL